MHPKPTAVPDPAMLRNALRDAARRWLEAHDREEVARKAWIEAARVHEQTMKEKSAWTDRLKKLSHDLGDSSVIYVGDRVVTASPWDVGATSTILIDKPDLERRK